MKIKNKSLKSDKKVYYFDHRYGVLKNKTRNKAQTLSALMAVTLVFGGGGVVANKLQDISQNKPLPGIYQRQGATVDTSKKEDESSDKLDDAVTKAREDDQLSKQIKDKLKNVPGGQKWSVYVRDLNSDRMASIDADKQTEAAGLGNLFLTSALESKTSAERWKYGNKKQNLAKCVELMISASDSDCAVSVGRWADMKNADNVIHGQGFKKTNIGGKDRKTTARDTGELLYRLQNGKVLSDKARRVIFDGLYGQNQREGIIAGCDEKCLIGSVNGENGKVRHEAAIVTSGDTKYVVVIMTQGATWSQIADVSKSIRLAFQP